MTNWPIGLSTGCFHHANILEILEPIRASGFHLLEVCSARTHLDYHDLPAVRAVAARLEQLGLEAFSFHAPFAAGIDISALEAGERERAVEEIFRAIEAAALLQVHYLVLHPGPELAERPADEERRRRMENTIASIERIARRCTESGLGCVLENKLPHLLFAHAPDLLWILAALRGLELGICLDTGHAFLSGELPTLLPQLAPHLRMIHAHDNRGQRDDHLAPGEGAIDWLELSRGLVAGQFHGPLVLELASQPDTAPLLAQARHGRTGLRRIARRLTLRHA